MKTRECIWCGNEYSMSFRSHQSKYCNDKCKGEYTNFKEKALKNKGLLNIKP